MTLKTLAKTLDPREFDRDAGAIRQAIESVGPLAALGSLLAFALAAAITNLDIDAIVDILPWPALHAPARAFLVVLIAGAGAFLHNMYQAVRAKATA